VFPAAIRRAHRLVLALFVIGAYPAASQTTTREFWPELDVYIQYNDRLRFILQSIVTVAPEIQSNQQSFTGFVEVALRPLIRLELRHKNDVFRKRFLTFRAGYRYITPLPNSSASPENRAIAEIDSRYPVPGKIVLTARNRGEFRFIRDRPFSMRYRGRLRAERDLAIRSVVFTPYADAEYDYDTRYGAWATMRYTAGLLLPAGTHVVVRPYIALQINKYSSHRHVGALGLNLNLYF